MGFFESNA